MEAKEYLRGIRACQRRVDYELARAEQEDDRTKRITQILSADNVQRTAVADDKTGDAIAALVDWKRALEADAKDVGEVCQELLRLLAYIKDPVHHEILFRRYINGETFEQIADAIGCSIRKVGYQHGDALKEFQEVLDEKVRRNYDEGTSD